MLNFGSNRSDSTSRLTISIVTRLSTISQPPARIFENQGKDIFAVLNADDPTTAGLSIVRRAQLFWFSPKKSDESVCPRTHLFPGWAERPEDHAAGGVPLKGAHN